MTKVTLEMRQKVLGLLEQIVTRTWYKKSQGEVEANELAREAIRVLKGKE